MLYADPAEMDGLICLIESEASMANRLEEVCLENKYEGSFKPALTGLPYLRAQTGTGTSAVFKTSSTLDGHRFASDFLVKGKATFAPDTAEQTLADHIKGRLGMAADGSTMPIARIPDAFPLVLELDAMSLIHGFQVSNEQISFVGLRLARALTASIVGLQCQRVTVPGVKFNVGQVESESGQAIFQKPRITAKKIEARFSVDVTLLSSLRLDALDAQGQPGQHQTARLQLLLALALWKIASFLDLLSVELSLRSECKLRLKRNEKSEAIGPKAKCEPDAGTQSFEFPFVAIAQSSLEMPISNAGLPSDRSPLILQFAS